MVTLWAHETDLPAPQSPAPAPPRLPQADAHARRPSDHPPASGEGTEEPRRLASVRARRHVGLHRTNRLGSSREIDAVVASGGRVTRPEFVLYHRSREATSAPRIAFAVGRRIG